jgi:mannose-6-phosphate isomerase-like protein (cupin superfamily)/DNA-binding XRE family transcriptional regulator
VRQQSGISLRALARQANVSASLISQIETGRLRPSVSTLYAVTGALGVPVADLLESSTEINGDDVAPGLYPVTTSGLAAMIALNPVAEHTAAPAVLTAPGSNGEDAAAAALDVPLTKPGAREAITLDSGVVWEIMGQLAGERVDFLRIIYPPGSSSSTGELMSHPGTEYGFLHSGELVMQLGDVERTLAPGDAVTFRSSTPHRFRNDGDVTAVGIWVVIDNV